MLKIANKEFKSRLILGTGKFGRLEDMYNAIAGSEAEMVTLALKRIDLKGTNASIIDHLSISSLNLLPNTSGARNAREAILAAHMAREAMETNWVKLEIHPDPRYLLPDAIETLIATEQLVKDGFVVLPYIHADPVLCKRLEDVGTAAVMPLGSPIGSNQGLITIDFLEIIIEQSKVPVIVDAGIGAPSDAVKAMEIGADAVLVNTAIAVAKDPVQMAIAFREAVKAGRLAFESGLGSKMKVAQPSSPLTGFLNLP
ncbi:thiazole synthase [Sphingobacterium rhinopitheci]|uniref:thiazole synthase n=1 Tax=Sphingobacterium rhinopitheci TaxID=2781960 RepID=UPI001F51A87E|nr:thiazole synthase [Sphingobacterium rhinopitheci]MCI0921802.1 thiazole synthase [Sphingobacterium rhinopitheci]